MSEGSSSPDVAIIGGGLAGLACAVALSESGFSIALYEASSRLAGRAQSWTDSVSGDCIDLGPHIFLSEYRNALSFLQRLNARHRVAWETDRLIRLREGAQITDMFLQRLPPPLHLATSMARVKTLSWHDKLSNRRILQLAMRVDEQLIHELDGMSAMDLLRQCAVSRRFIQWFWSTACLTVMNVPLEQCSAGALLRVFAQLIGRRRYRIGFAACGLAELFVPEAVKRIEQSAGRIYLGAPVRQFLTRDSTLDGLLLGDGSHVRARHYVCAVPPRELHSMLPEHVGAIHPFKELLSFEPSPYISTYLWFDRKLTDEKFWAFINDASHLNSDFYDLSNIREGWQARPSLIASNIIFSHRSHSLSDEQIVRQTHEEISVALPTARNAMITHAVVNRIPMAIPCPKPGTEAKRMPTVTALAGLLVAGDWTRTHLPACMESAVYSGWSAAEVILRARGRDEEWTLPVKRLDGFVGVINRVNRRRAFEGKTA